MSRETDDAKLVRDAIDECLAQAGKLLHPDQSPDRPGRSRTASAWYTDDQSRVPTMDFYRAQFLMTRVQYLRMLDVADAAAYLRAEMLEALKAARADEERQRAKPKNPITPEALAGMLTAAEASINILGDGFGQYYYTTPQYRYQIMPPGYWTASGTA